MMTKTAEEYEKELLEASHMLNRRQSYINDLKKEIAELKELVETYKDLAKHNGEIRIAQKDEVIKAIEEELKWIRELKEDILMSERIIEGFDNEVPIEILHIRKDWIENRIKELLNKLGLGDEPKKKEGERE